MASLKESVDEMSKVTSPNTECMMKYLDVNQERGNKVTRSRFYS